MKELIKKIASIIFIATFVLLHMSCNDEHEVITENEVPIELMSYEQQLEYLNSNLKTVGKTLLKLSKSTDFKRTVYREVEKQFDGDYNILIENLLQAHLDNGASVNSRITQVVSESELEAFSASLEAFKGIDGEFYYPQIYIPYYDILLENLESGRVATQSEPTLVIFNGDESKDSFPGYNLTEDGVLVENGMSVDEDYALNNEVWVISLNETFTNECPQQAASAAREILPIDDCGGGGSGGGGTGGGGGSTPSYDPTFQNMKVKCHKESWAAGKSEISLIRYYADTRIIEGDLRPQGVYSRVGSSDPTGNEIRQFSRKDVNRKRNIAVNYIYAPSFDGNGWDNDYNVVVYVIFECDSWPTGKKNVEIWHPLIPTFWSGNLERRLQAVNIEYRSADGFYAADAIWGASPEEIIFDISNLGYKNEFDSYSVNNSCIEFNSIL